MERRRRQQRLKINERQGRSTHVHGRRLSIRPRLHRGPDHLHHPLPRHRQGQPRRQIDPFRQHHGQARKGLRQQVPRIHEGGEGMSPAAHRQGDGAKTASFVAPADQIPDYVDEGWQQAQAVDRRPHGHRAQEHPAGPGARLPQSQQQQPASQQQRCGEQGQQRPEILPAAQHQRRQQRERRPAPGDGHPAQGSGQPQQQPVDGEVVQQKPFQGDPHATSTTMTVMSSRWPFPFAAMRRASAIRSRGWFDPFLSSASMSLPSRS